MPTYPESFDREGLLRGRVRESDGSPELALAGELDMTGADALEARLAQLAAQSSGDVVVDLAAITYIDSSGMRIFLRAHLALEGSGRRLVLRSPSRVVRRIIDVTGLDLFHVEDAG